MAKRQLDCRRVLRGPRRRVAPLAIRQASPRRVRARIGEPPPVRPGMSRRKAIEGAVRIARRLRASSKGRLALRPVHRKTRRPGGQVLPLAVPRAVCRRAHVRSGEGSPRRTGIARQGSSSGARRIGLRSRSLPGQRLGTGLAQSLRRRGRRPGVPAVQRAGSVFPRRAKARIGKPLSFRSGGLRRRDISGAERIARPIRSGTGGRLPAGRARRIRGSCRRPGTHAVRPGLRCIRAPGMAARFATRLAMGRGRHGRRVVTAPPLWIREARSNAQLAQLFGGGRGRPRGQAAAASGRRACRRAFVAAGALEPVSARRRRPRSSGRRRDAQLAQLLGRGRRRAGRQAVARARLQAAGGRKRTRRAPGRLRSRAVLRHVLRHVLRRGAVGTEAQRRGTRREARRRARGQPSGGASVRTAPGRGRFSAAGCAGAGHRAGQPLGHVPGAGRLFATVRHRRAPVPCTPPARSRSP